MKSQESLAPLIELHLDGQLTADQSDRLAALLKESDDAAARFWRAVHLHHAVVELADQQWGQISIAHDCDESSEPQSIDSIFPAPISFKEQANADQAQVGFKEVAQTLGYLLNQTLRKHRVALVTATAAVLAVGVLLAIQLLGPDTAPVVDNTQPKPAASAEPTPRGSTVATLTATHNAQWSGGPASAGLRIGDTLRAGTRLTLTAGFAEITTHRGAVAILQAPATVELLDNNNALRLHTGKLLGICETDSAKGLLVRTPYMDVIDIGTEFGVHVYPNGVETTVFVGEIELQTHAGESQRLTRNQSARLNVNANNSELVFEDRVAEGYVRRVPREVIVTRARINDDRFKAEVVTQGMVQGVKMFTDRGYELKGFDANEIPTELFGGDLIRIPADARPTFSDNAENLQVELEVTRPTTVYLLFTQADAQSGLPAWVSKDYELTPMRMTLDPGQRDAEADKPARNHFATTDQDLQVWKRKQVASGRTVVAGHMQLHFTYAIVVVPVEEDRP